MDYFCLFDCFRVSLPLYYTNDKGTWNGYPPMRMENKNHFVGEILMALEEPRKRPRKRRVRVLGLNIYYGSRTTPALFNLPTLTDLMGSERRPNNHK